jgi:UDP-N-acetylenolpyruvoylglucosamine reductase
MLVKELLEDKNWSDAVTNGPGSTFAKPGIHTKKAEEIVAEYKRKGVSPNGLGSAIQMLQFYINRAGKNLKNSAELHKAIKILQADLEKEHEKESSKK